MNNNKEDTYERNIWAKSDLPWGWKEAYTHIEMLDFNGLADISNDEEHSGKMSWIFIQCGGIPSPRGAFIYSPGNGIYTFLHPLIIHDN